MPELLAPLMLPALIGLLITSALLTVTTDWRLTFATLAAQYLLSAVLIAQAVIVQVAAVRAVAGLLVVLILVMTGRQVNFGRAGASAPGDVRRSRLAALRQIEFQTNLPFRVIAILLVMLAAWYAVTGLGYVLPGVPLSVNLAGIVLVALGLLNLGLTEEPMNAGVGLLMALNGFQLLYTPIESSRVVAALLAAVDFGLTLAVCRLALLRYGAREEP